MLDRPPTSSSRLNKNPVTPQGMPVVHENILLGER
jgi:hypothetical protein